MYDLVGDQPADAEPDRNIAAPVATAAAVTEPPQDYAYRWVERDDDVDEVDDVVAPPAPPLRARPAAETAYVRPELDFAKSGYGTQQWYRTKPAAGGPCGGAHRRCRMWRLARFPESGHHGPRIADEHADKRRAGAEQCRADCGERPQAQTQTGSPATSASTAASTIG